MLPYTAYLEATGLKAATNWTDPSNFISESSAILASGWDSLIGVVFIEHRLFRDIYISIASKLKHTEQQNPTLISTSYAVYLRQVSLICIIIDVTKIHKLLAIEKVALNLSVCYTSEQLLSTGTRAQCFPQVYKLIELNYPDC